VEGEHGAAVLADLEHVVVIAGFVAVVAPSVAARVRRAHGPRSGQKLRRKQDRSARKQPSQRTPYLRPPARDGATDKSTVWRKK
jgi:hypothetical protein